VHVRLTAVADGASTSAVSIGAETRVTSLNGTVWGTPFASDLAFTEYVVTLPPALRAVRVLLAGDSF
jgi:hypothetical protein